MARLRIMALWMLLGLTACGGAGGGNAVLLPTPTRDLVAYFEPTLVSPGTAANPLQLLFVPPDPTAVGDAVGVLSNALVTRSGVNLQFVTLATDAEALAILCDYNDGSRFAAAWLNAPSLAIADANGCGDIVLQAVRGTSPSLRTQIVTRRSVGALSNLRGQTFCRLDESDFYSWVMPNLILQANRFDPTSLGNVREYGTYPELFNAFVDNTCAATGIPAGLLDSDTLDAAAVSAVSVTIESVPIPYGVLVVPPELLLGAREALITALLDVAGLPDGTPLTPEDEPPTINPALLTPEQAALFSLLGAESVVRATRADFEDVYSFMAATGLNLTEFAR
ncbi:MAG: PhnD/SsuA/transferrin family substrate-binding protein [Phototrophicaceae bacterium]